jgi:hypothetical protein
LRPSSVLRAPYLCIVIIAFFLSLVVHSCTIARLPKWLLFRLDGFKSVEGAVDRLRSSQGVFDATNLLAFVNPPTGKLKLSGRIISSFKVVINVFFRCLAFRACGEGLKRTAAK